MQLEGILSVCRSFIKRIEWFRAQYPFQYAPSHDCNGSLLYKSIKYLTQHLLVPPACDECVISHHILIAEGGNAQLKLAINLFSISLLDVFQQVGTLKGLVEDSLDSVSGEITAS